VDASGIVTQLHWKCATPALPFSCRGEHPQAMAPTLGRFAAALSWAHVLQVFALRRKPQGRSDVFVHLFEWSWDDIARECEDWLGPKGFSAAQVSPPTEHIKGNEWWTRYQPVTYNLTSRSGDEAAFASMVKRCKKAGVSIYVDAVLNHVAASKGTSIAGNKYGGRSTPIFNPQDFHHMPFDVTGNCGVNDFADVHNVQFCDLQGLPDLCTECGGVQDKIAAYLNRLVELGVSGLRLDAAKHIPKADLAKIFEKVHGADKLLKYVEVSKATSVDAVKEESYMEFANVIEFNYYSQLDANIAETGRMSSLESLGTAPDLLPGSVAIVFVDNHDLQRSKDSNVAKLTYKSGKLYKLASAYMLAHPYGYPQIMSSFHFSSYDQGPPSAAVHKDNGDLRCGEFEPWVCEHRWPGIANMVKWRRTASDHPVTHFMALGEDTVSFCRGSVACVAFNRQESDEWVVNLDVPLDPGEYCDVASSDGVGCPLVKVDHDKTAQLTVPAQGFVAFHVGARKKVLPEDDVVDLGQVQVRRARHRQQHQRSFLIEALGVDVQQ